MADNNPAGNNLLRESVTRIPLYTGDGNDSFTPAQWLARVEKARLTAAWDDANTMAFIYVSLRGKAQPLTLPILVQLSSRPFHQPQQLEQLQ